ncbi:hypothetical protein F4604DRAFT_2045663, partial [Suillus subluteus]
MSTAIFSRCRMNTTTATFGGFTNRLLQDFGIVCAFFVGFLAILFTATEFNTASAFDIAVTPFKQLQGTRTAMPLLGLRASSTTNVRLLALRSLPSEDDKVMIRKVESSVVEDLGHDHWVPQYFDPVARIDASLRKIGQVLFHPTASNVLASASSEHTIKLWDLADTDRPRSVLAGHNDTIQCLAFNPFMRQMASRQ